ncbi:MAG: bifunctional UDP-4-amino-4-deoxy-L-arabinose formyltransferase/UDP-glucuronic acid oxidase ArnA [Acidobacteria bacterium]|nr:bifunctional UDP-4-amino-4-deoxy-L-arabinose formyltransferase/UDP-glucuronic acid oxidase ArnA [Acidobacteriota bacterium]
MKTVVFAYHNMGCAGIRSLLEQGWDIGAVFTYQDDPEETTWFESVAELAASHNIPLYTPENVNHPLWIEKIRKIAPDFIFSFYYRNLLKPEILNIPAYGCLNLHGSLLPRYRGRAPINWVLVNGETETGVTLHYMTEKPDDGDIVAQEKISIDYSDTGKSLNERMTEASERMLRRVLPELEKGAAPRVPQNQEEASYFGRRTPEDGRIDWNHDAEQIRNLVRAVTKPYPGAFSYLGQRKFFVWEASTEAGGEGEPGTVLSISPFRVRCKKGVLQIQTGQLENGSTIGGCQLAEEMGVTPGISLGTTMVDVTPERKKSVLILGVNGFIGNALSHRLLTDGKYEIYGMDLRSNNIQELLSHPDFHFREGDISIHREWIEYHVRKCDIVMPLVAIATPIEYMRNPLRVFELDFEENLRIIRYCVKYSKRVLFPSTSEVYGMCPDPEFEEDHSVLVTGPIRMQRWIYSTSKQLMDRVIWAYGQRDGLPFTLFRPFNWIGPKLDSLESARIGSSRAITQLILNLVQGTPIQLVDGGNQKRCFTDVSEGIECLFRLIENHRNNCNGQIVNIGNPKNEWSIRELAEILVKTFEQHPMRDHFPSFAGFREVSSMQYYGKGYQDIQHRLPSIRNAKRLVDWEPVIPLEESVFRTLDYFLNDVMKKQEVIVH